MGAGLALISYVAPPRPDAAAGLTSFATGETVYSRGTGTYDWKALTVSGTWTFTFGTGKLSGIKGKGTYACKMMSAERGSGYACDVAGEYSLPPAKK